MNIYHIALKEFKSFFISPIGYVIIGVYFLLSGWNTILRLSHYSMESIQYDHVKASPERVSYFSSLLNIDTGIIEPVFGFSSLLILFLFPAITMKLFAEEKRSGSFELLKTSPVTLTEIILGKFFGALAFLSLILIFSFSFIFMLFFWSTPEYLITLSGILGIFLFTSAIVAFGIFASTLTENQIIAFFIGFGGSLFFYIISWISFNNSSAIGEIATYFSLISHLMNFLRGTPSTIDLSYFLSFIVLFLFFSYRKLDMERWR